MTDHSKTTENESQIKLNEPFALIKPSTQLHCLLCLPSGDVIISPLGIMLFEEDLCRWISLAPKHHFWVDFKDLIRKHYLHMHLLWCRHTLDILHFCTSAKTMKHARDKLYHSSPCSSLFSNAWEHQEPLTGTKTWCSQNWMTSFDIIAISLEGQAALFHGWSLLPD